MIYNRSILETIRAVRRPSNGSWGSFYLL